MFGDRGTLKIDDFSGKSGGMARIKGYVKGFERVNVNKKTCGPSRTMAHLEPENLEQLTLPRIDRGGGNKSGVLSKSRKSAEWRGRACCDVCADFASHESDGSFV